jgi:hypothetical protein
MCTWPPSPWAPTPPRLLKAIRSRSLQGPVPHHLLRPCINHGMKASMGQASWRKKPRWPVDAGYWPCTATTPSADTLCGGPERSGRPLPHLRQAGEELQRAISPLSYPRDFLFNFLLLHSARFLSPGRRENPGTARPARHSKSCAAPVLYFAGRAPPKPRSGSQISRSAEIRSVRMALHRAETALCRGSF